MKEFPDLTKKVNRDTIHHNISTLLKTFSETGTLVKLRLKGNSMFPFLRGGDIVTVSTELTNIEVGDIALYYDRSNNKIQAHRIICRSKNYCQLKGDNLNKNDGFRYIYSLIGLIVKIERQGKNIRFGLGPEKKFIAFFSRLNILNKFTRLHSLLPKQ